MLAVIFRARVRSTDGQPLDAEYAQTAQRLRDLAFTEFGCLAFHSCAEGQDEITVSYWPDRDTIMAWRGHPEHVRAQELGRERWYDSYSVEVCDVMRAYAFPRT